jgi:hypothetical protein
VVKVFAIADVEGKMKKITLMKIQKEIKILRKRGMIFIFFGFKSNLNSK